MNYLTIKETAVRWGVSERTVNALCTAGRVVGAQKFAGAWAIPENAEKPIDPRKQRKLQAELEASIEHFETATEDLPDILTQEKPLHLAMPLLNTPFKLGEAKKAAEEVEDEDARNIALAEYYYFSGQPEMAAVIAEPYLSHEDVALRLSACWIYAYANLALDRIPKAKLCMGILQQMVASIDENTPVRDKALITCVSTGASVLLHLPLPKILTPLKQYIHMMQPGLRLFVLYIEAHHSYLNGQYGVAVGIAETALALESEIYPIPTIYLHLVASMGYINMNHPEMAKEHLKQAWKIAEADDLIEAFGEHHGLLGGSLEGTFKKTDPDAFKRMIDITYKFSAGWRKVHNPETGHDVADDLSTTEFAVSMLAARGWTNQEIADHMGLSEYTVRNHISVAMQSLNITQRTDLIKFMLK